MKDVIVRCATSNDLDAVVALRLALLREYPEHPIYGRLRQDAEERARPIFAQQLEAEHEMIALAELAGTAIGLLRCVETSASPLLMPDKYCYVSSVYVKPEYRRQGGAPGALPSRSHVVPGAGTHGDAPAQCRRSPIGRGRMGRVGIRGRRAGAGPAPRRRQGGDK